VVSDSNFVGSADDTDVEDSPRVFAPETVPRLAGLKSVAAVLGAGRGG
jgi:hypothetical protein